MLAHARGFFSDHVDPHEVGKQWLRKARRMVDRGMAARGRLGESAFLDVRYEDLLADPLKQVHRVADFIGAPLSPDASSVMSGFLADNPQHHHGRHEYAISDFGLSEAEVVRSFAAYRARFGFGDG
jgi:hypothetical protein